MTIWRVSPAAQPVALGSLLDRLRPLIADRHGAASTVERITANLLTQPPTLNILTAEQRSGASGRLAGRIVHAEDGFSLVALVIGPGQRTSIHDHLTWCVVTVLSGTEDETVYLDRGDHLIKAGHSTNTTGSVTPLTPPGDIHRVCNSGGVAAVSLHVYGVDLRLTASSVRRIYDGPVRTSPASGLLGVSQGFSDRSMR
jgi:predicted metal-dependent enzyme (double-stranded beta helix superfamily)